MFTRAMFFGLLLISQVVPATEFTSSDINTAIAGSTVNAGASGFDLTASGADIWNTNDGFRFHYKEVNGDFDIRARVSSVENVDGWSKAGVAVRQSLTSTSAHAMTVATPGNGFAFQYRTVDGGNSSHVYGGATSYPFTWVRLLKIGQSLMSYKSVDPSGDEWEFIGSISLTTSDPLYVGLIVTAHNNSALCKAEFRNVDLHAYVQPITGNGQGLSAQYFNSRNLDTPSVLSRIDAAVNFDWADGSPDTAVNPNSFSVRWCGEIQAQFDEDYTFYTISDDGVRLWIDGNLVVDHWIDHARTENRTYPVALVAGQKYKIIMEFFENGGLAEARLLWSSPSTFKEPIPQNQLYTANPVATIGNGIGLKGDYFTGRNFNTKVLSQVDSTVDFSWGTGSPSVAVGSNDFSIRWSGLIEAKFTGQCTFYTVSDDGVRLWVDNQLIINNWSDHSTTENTGTIALSAGKKYSIRMEFYENSGDAVSKLSWSSVDLPKEVVPASQLYPGLGTGLFAQYFDNIDFTSAKLSRIDSVIDFDWGSASPHPSIAPDTYSVRWSGQVEPLYSEAYSFHTISDDGVRLWINDQLVIDNWSDHAATENSSSPILLTAGQPVNIRMDFYENGGLAVAKLLWSSTSQVKQTVPSTQLHPNGGILVNIPVASAVSPAFIEGTSWSPTGQPFTINASGTTITTLGEKVFYANLVLDQFTATPVSFTHSVTGVTASGSVIWSPTNLSGKTESTDQILLRKGDSLLLTGTGSGQTLSIDGNGDGIADFTGVPGDKCQYTFSTPGTYLTTAKIDSVSIGTILVNVIDVNLTKPIAAEVGFPRTKNVVVSPASASTQVYFVPVDSKVLSVFPLGPFNTEDGQGMSIQIKPLCRGTPILLARLGSPVGAIIGYREIDEFTFYTTAQFGVLSFSDGSTSNIRKGKATLVMSPYVPQVDADLTVHSATVTFRDGLLSMRVPSSDFEIDPGTGDGKYEYVIEFDRDAEHVDTCHTIEFSQATSARFTITGPKGANGCALDVMCSGCACFGTKAFNLVTFAYVHEKSGNMSPYVVELIIAANEAECKAGGNVIGSSGDQACLFRRRSFAFDNTNTPLDGKSLWIKAYFKMNPGEAQCCEVKLIDTSGAVTRAFADADNNDGTHETITDECGNKLERKNVGGGLRLYYNDIYIGGCDWKDGTNGGFYKYVPNGGTDPTKVKFIVAAQWDSVDYKKTEAFRDEDQNESLGRGMSNQKIDGWRYSSDFCRGETVREYFLQPYPGVGNEDEGVSPDKAKVNLRERGELGVGPTPPTLPPDPLPNGQDKLSPRIK